MERYFSCADLRERLDGARAKGQRVGMVGTSGAMHRGHLSLIERAVADNDVTALFWGGGTVSDWMSAEIPYERDETRDLALAEGAGLDIVFTPSNDELFRREPMTRVSLPAMSSTVAHLEDPAHLDLIVLVMCKLWNVFGPCRAYFGEKDWQQLAVYQRLADDLAFPVEVIGCPTVREEDGLAVSSRNAQLSASDRAIAPVLYRALCAARQAALDGTREVTALEKVFVATIGASAGADRMTVNYFSPVDAATMVPLDEVSGAVRLLGSISLGSVRLVDNVGVRLPPPGTDQGNRSGIAERGSR